MDTLWQDLRYGVRMLWKNPGFTVIAVISLALGIGANTTIFSVINAVMFQPLRYKEPDRLMVIWETEKKNRGSNRMPPTANVVDWKNQSQTFEDIGMVSPGSGPSNLTGLGPAERIREQMASPNLFSVLGVNPVLGRTFVKEDVRSEDSRPVLLSYEYWKRRFDEDPKVLGLSFYVNGVPRTVIGVMPPEFSVGGGRDVDLWQTTDPNHSRWAKRTDQWLMAVGRLRAGGSIEQAKAEMDAIAARMEHAYPGSNKDVGVLVEPLSEAFSNRGAGTFLYPLFGAVGFVLLIACTNVANLLLARMTARQKEIAVRASLGAGRWRMVRQLLTESSLLALFSGTLGAVLSIWGVDLVLALTPERGLGNFPVHIDIQVLAFTIGVSVLTGLLFGLAPALSASKLDLAQALKTGAVPRLRSSGSRLLVVTEVALAMVLLVGAGLMINSLLRLHRVDPGFDPENLLTMEIFLSGPRYVRNLPDNMKQVTPEVTSFYRQVLDRIERVPGVESAGIVGQLPTRYLEQRTFTILGKAAPPSGQRTGYSEMSPAYFRSMRIPLKSGRYIEERDTEISPWVAVVSDAFVRLYFPNENPIGQFIVTRTEPYRVEEPKPRQIVGVVGDVKWGLRSDAPPAVYASYRQQPDALPGGRATGHLRQNLVLRFTPGTEARQGDAVTAIRKMVAEIDKDQPVYSVMTMEQILSASVWAWRFYSQLLGVFAAAALILSALGIYGVMSYFVSQRTREIGIRMALGGDRADVMKLVIWHGLSLTGVGLIVGAAAAFALTGLIARLLYGVTPTDPLTFASVALLMAAVALVASYVPARRAARVDPLTAVRQE